MFRLGIAEISRALAAGEFSSEELTTAYLARIKEKDKDFNAYITLCEEQALSQAKAADSKRAKGEADLLTGVPLAHKDIFCTKGIKTSCGSRMLDNFIAPYDATVVDKFNQAGIVCWEKPTWMNSPWVLQMKPVITVPYITPGTRSWCQVALQEAPLQQLPLIYAPLQRPLIPAVPFANQLLFVDSLV